MIFQDFVAVNSEGEYDPQFDSPKYKPVFRIVVDDSLDPDEWYWDFSNYHG